MGAVFHTEVFDGSLSVNDLRKQYNSRVEDLSVEYGTNAYNGTFTTLNGIEIEDRTFDTEREADEYLNSKAMKWQNAIAVKYKDQRSQFKKEPTFAGKKAGDGSHLITQRTVGQYALKAISERYSSESDSWIGVPADQLKPAQQQALLAAHGAWRAKRREFLTLDQDIAIRADKFKRPDNEFTTEDFRVFKTLIGRRRKIWLAAEKTAAKLSALDQKLAKKLYETEIIDHGVKWLVGGVCAE
jgi:preprotein translocase subunit SecA